MGGVIKAATKEGAANRALFSWTAPDRCRPSPEAAERTGVHRRRQPAPAGAAPYYLDGKSGQKVTVVPVFSPGEETAVALRRPQRVL